MYSSHMLFFPPVETRKQILNHVKLILDKNKKHHSTIKRLLDILNGAFKISLFVIVLVKF